MEKIRTWALGGLTGQKGKRGCIIEALACDYRPSGPSFIGKLCLETLEDLLSVVPLVSVGQSGVNGQPEKGKRQGPEESEDRRGVISFVDICAEGACSCVCRRKQVFSF